jgi:hypothetical protein
MRKITLIFVLITISVCCTIGQTATSIYSITNDNIIVHPSFVDNYYIDESSTLVPYTYKKTTIIIPNSSYGTFSLKFSKFNGYEDEPGFGNVIDVLKNGTVVLQLRSSMGFTQIPGPAYEGQDFVLVNLSSDTYAIIFREWIYENEPSMVSVVLVYKGNSKLVYNKPMFIKSITKQTGSFNMVLQSNSVEYEGLENPTPSTTPILHTIFWDGSTLKFN